MRVSSCFKTLLFFRFSFCRHKHSWNSSRCLDKNITFCRRTRGWGWPDTSSKPPNAAGKYPDLSLKVSSGVWKQERRSLFLAWLKCHHRPPPPADMKGSSYWQQGWRWSDWSTCRHEESRPKNIWFLSCPRELQQRGRKLRFKFADTCKDPGESAAPTGRAIHFFFLQNFQKIHQSGLRLSDVKLLSALLKALLLLLMRPANSKSLERKPLCVERQRKHQEQSHAPHSAQPSLKIPRRAVKKVLLTKRHCFCLTSC